MDILHLLGEDIADILEDLEQRIVVVIPGDLSQVKLFYLFNLINLGG